jgi:hypothetical protein
MQHGTTIEWSLGRANLKQHAQYKQRRACHPIQGVTLVCHCAFVSGPATRSVHIACRLDGNHIERLVTGSNLRDTTQSGRGFSTALGRFVTAL